ncbi:MAG TPA: tyrosine recombinase [Acidimicrobiia bacterium]
MTSSALPLRDAVEEYLASLKVEAGLSPNTIAAYRRDLSQYLEYLSGREPTPEEVDGFSAELVRRGLADSTHKRKLSAVKGLHRFLVSEGLREDDPTRLVTGPRRPDPFPKALEIDEAIALVEAPDRSTVGGRRDAALLEFLYATGARVSEAVALDLPDLDLDEGVVIVTGKGAKQRLVPIGSKAVEAIRAWLPDRLELVKRSVRGDPVFLNLRGGRLTRQGAFDVVRKNAIRAGIRSEKVSPHVLRHSAATHMVEAGADLRTVQEMLGHATISTTQVYTRVSRSHVMEIYVQAHPRSR